MTSLKVQFGKRVKEIRKSKKITQEQLAELINIESPNVSKIECGMHFPAPENIEKIAKALDVEVYELFEFSHIQRKQDLIKYINDSVMTFDGKALELIYKFISNLNLYR